jgi:hypothetical protein
MEGGEPVVRLRRLGWSLGDLGPVRLRGQHAPELGLGLCDVDQPVVSAQLIDGRDRPQVRRVLKALDRPPFDLGALDGVQLRAQSVALGLGLA